MNLTTILRTAKAALTSSSISNLATTTSSSRKPRSFTSALLVLSFVFSLLRVESGWGQTQTITVTSSGYWICPTGVTSITVQCIGGGGAGTRAAANNTPGGGGGGGAYASSTLTVVPGTTYAVCAGFGGAAGNPAMAGGDSFFGSNLVLAKGGSANANNVLTGAVGGLASASIGQTTRNGGNGGTGSGTNAGAGGGAAGATAVGGNGGTGTTVGQGNAPGGNGGAGRTASNGVGIAGSTYGGGGGGALRVTSSSNGGAGANGVVIITYSGASSNMVSPCSASAIGGTTYLISNFTTTSGVSNINNSTSGNNYSIYNLVASNYSGSVTNFSISHNATSGGAGLGLWIDWNSDGDFADANETVGVTTGWNYGTFSGVINIPAGATSGIKVMRVVMDYSNIAPSACPSAVNGEVEDYIFQVLPCVAPSSQTTSLTSSSITASAATLNWTNGNGAGRVVYINSTNSFINPTNGLNPTASTSWSNAGQQCIYNGTGTGPVTVTGLSASTTYYVRAYEYCAPDRNYQTATATGNSNSFTTAAPSPTITVSSLSSFGNYCVNGTSSASSFTLSAAYLSPSNAVVTVSAPSGFMISTSSNGSYYSSLTLNASSGSISNTIYVVFQPTNIQSYSGNITISGGSATTQTIAVSGNGVSTGSYTGVYPVLTASNGTICLGNPSNLNVICYSSNTAPTYVAPPAVTYPTSDEDFANITITNGSTTILNNSTPINSLVGTIGTASGTAGSYSNFTAFGPYNLTAGTTYNLSISSSTTGTAYDNYMAVYIDYNRDGDFNDAGENVYTSPGVTSGAHTESTTFTVPLTAINGRMRMRVYDLESSTVVLGPIISGGYGEYEEYMLNISSSNYGGPTMTPTIFSWSPSATLSLMTSSSAVAAPVVATSYSFSTTVNGCQVLSNSTNIAVNSLPTISATATSATICLGTNTGLTATGGSTYAWSPSTNLSAGTGASTSFTPTASGNNQSYTVTGTDINGCSNTAQVSVNVLGVPASVSVTGTTPNCNSTILTASGGSGGSIYYQGSTSNGTSTTTLSSSQTVNASGTYYFRSYNGTCFGPQGSLAVVINTQPVITAQPSNLGETKCNLSQSFSPLSITATGSNLTYQWYSNTTASTSGGTSITGATSASYTPSNATVGTTYYYCVVSSASCPSTTSAVSGPITVITSPNQPNISPASLTVNVGASTSFTASLDNSNNSLRWWDALTNGNQVDPDISISGLDNAVFNSYQAQSPPALPNTTAVANVAFCTPNTTYTYYVEEFNAVSGCPSVRIPFTITTNPLVSINNTTLCQSGATSTLTANITLGAGTIQWSQSTDSLSFTNIVGANNSILTVTPTITTVYRLNGSSLTPFGCSALNPLPPSLFNVDKKVVYYPPVDFTPTASPSTQCSGATVTLNSNLSSGNFSVSSISYIPYAVPTTADTLIKNGQFNPNYVNGGNLDDGGVSGIPIPFTYNFFGSSYNTLAAGTNAVLMFGTVPGYNANAGNLGFYSYSQNASNCPSIPNGASSGQVFPNCNNPANIIALMAGDQTFKNYSGITNPGKLIRWTSGIAPTRVYNLLYENVPSCCASTNSTFTGYVRLFETTGVVEIHILNKNSTNASTIGLQNSNQTIGATAPNRIAFTSQITTSEAYRFTPSSSYTYSWSNLGAVVPYSNSATITSLALPNAVNTVYTVNATSGTTGCTSSKDVTITINPLPSAPISGGPVTTCTNSASTTLTATAQAGCVVEWYSTNTATGSPLATSNVYTFTPPSTAGTYTYYAFARNSSTSCASSLATSVVLTVVQAPVSPTTSATLSYCQGASAVPLTATGTALTWYQGTTVLTGAPTPVTSAATTLNYSVTQTQSGCPSNPAAITVTVIGTPSLTNGSLAESICNGSTSTPVTLTSNSSGAASFAWTASASSPSVTGFTSSGSTASIPVQTIANTSNLVQTVTYAITPSNTVGSLSCPGPVSNYVISVNPSLTASVVVNASTTSVCTGGAITFTATPTNGGTSPSYQWFLNSTTTPVAGQTSATYTLASPVAGDQVFVKMTSSPAPNCLISSTNPATSNTITLNTAPATPVVNIVQSTPSTTVCSGTSVNFSIATSTALGSNPTYQWLLNGTAISGATSATYTTSSLVNNDVISLLVTSSITANCLTQTTATSQGITMLVTPITTITSQPVGVSVCQGATPVLTSTATGTGVISYQWQSCTSATATTGTNLSSVSYPTAITTSLTTPAAGATAGFYRLVATGSCGTATSNIATISINTPTAITTPPTAQAICEGTTATFTTVAQGQGTISYQWLLNGSTISGANSASYAIPNLASSNAGLYSVAVTATCGTVTSSAVQLTVNPLTTISTQPVSTNLCEGSSLSLSVLASGTSPMSYQWNYNGTAITGATSSIYTDPTTVVSESGSYTVTVTGGCSVLTSSVAAVVINLNTAITAQPVSYTGCALNPTSLSVSGVGTNLQYQWYIGSNPSTLVAGATSPTLSFSNPQTSNSGSYTVTLTGVCGTQSSNIALVTINPVPPAGTINGGNSGVCVGSTINLTNLASGGVWTSSNPAMGSISSTGVLTGVSPGTITVTYTVTNSFGCVSTATKVIQVKGLPTAVIQTPLATSICQGESMNLQSSAAVSYAWSNGGTTQNIAVNSSAVGTVNYTVTVTGTNACTATSAPVAITVIPVPTVGAITGTGNFPNFCLGNTSNLTNATANGIWSSSNTNVLTVNPLSGAANTLTIGTATVSYYVANIPGCLNPNPGTATTTITVSTPPAAFITSSGSTTFCQGGNVTLTAPSGVGYNYLWSTGATTQSIVVSTSGSYSLTVTATGGCSVTSLPTTVNVLPIPTATIYPTGAINICSGTNVTLSTGSAVSYVWSNGANTPTISVNAAGSYSVTLTGTNGCTVTSAVSTVTVTPVPSAVITANGPTNICDGGSVGLSVPAAQSYLWSTGATTQAITATSTGNYSVTATNGICSTTSTPTYVNFNPVPSSTVTTSGPTTFCQGGSVTLSAPTGNSFTYLWSNGATTQSITVAASGTHSVTVSNSFNCSSTSTPITVVVNALPTASITAGGSTTICSGNSLSLTAASANAYLWNTGATTQSINASTSGNYTVQAISAAGCTATSSVVALNVLPSPTAVITQASGTTFCQGGSVVINSTPASAYLWSNNETTQAISATTSGVYSVLVTAANGCTATSNSINVTVLPTPTAVIYPGTNVNICAGSTVTLSTGTAASYTWSNGANTPTITVGTNSTHTVTLVGSNGCTATSALTTVTVNPIPVATITASGTTNICSGTSVNLSAPTAGSYLWSNGATTQSIAASLAGAYTVTVTTAGCSATSAATTVNVNQSPTANVTASGPTSFCQGGTVSFTANAGNGYGYLWNDGSTTASITANTSGNYSVTVTNQIGCSTTSVINAVVVNPIPTATITASGSTTICSGSPVSLSAPVGGSYLWNTGSTTQAINASNAGNYTVTVSTLAGCSATSAPTTVIVNALPSASISSSGSTTFCQGGSVSLSAAGGLSSYLWNTGATTSSLNASTSGSYSVTVTNSNGCSATSSPTLVNVLTAPTAVIYPGTNINICAGSTVTLSTGTAASYTWSNGTNTPTITVGSNGTHTVTLTGSNGCTATSAITTVTVNPIPVATITAAGSTNICSGTSVLLSAPTADTYLWSNGATTQSITASLAGSYSVTITTAGCSATSTATSVNVNPAPTAVVTASGPTSFCQGGSVSFTANSGNGYTYLWSNGATTASITTSTSGNNTVTVTNQIGCSTTSAVNAVVVNPIPTATITAGGSTTICSGTSVALNASAGSSYLWSNGATTQSINASNAGNYTVSVTSAAGCSAASIPTAISVNPLPSAAISSSGSTTFCQGGSVSLSGTSGMTSYLWSTGATSSTINATASGNYSVTVTNANGCSATSTPTAVTVNQGPVAQIYPGTNLTICSGSNVTLSTNSASGYTWSNGSHSATIQVNTAGTYSVVLTGSNGCSSTSPVTTVVVTPTPAATIASSGPTTICQGSSVTLSAPASASSYLWNNGATTQSITATLVGSYFVTVGSNGCNATSPSTFVSYNPVPSAAVSASGPTTFCQGSSVTFSAPAGNGNTYLWNTGATTQTVNTTTAGNFSVTVTNGYGCSASSTISTVVVNPLPVVTPITGSSSICAGTQGQVSNVMTGGVYASSNLGTASIGQLNGQISGLTAGTTTISYLYTDNNGCSSTVTYPVTIIAAPVATITAGGPTTFCQGGSVVLTASSGTAYAWNTGATTASITATTAGSYTVTVTGANGCSASSQATTVNVLTPSPVSAINGASAVCVNSATTLTNATSGGTWSSSNPLIASVSSTGNVTGVSAGSATITYAINSTNGCQNAATKIMTVNSVPSTALTASGATTFCQGGNVQLTASSGATYVWSNGATTSAITATTAGTYNVTVTNANGCSSVSTNQTITVNANPTAQISTNGSTNLCTGGSITLMATPSASYLWSNGATTSSITTSTAGAYTVSVTNANGCSATSTATTVVVNASPSATVTAGGPTSICSGNNVVLTATAGTGNTYQWTKNGVLISGATSNTYSASTSGSYAVIVTNASGCTVTSVATPVSVILASVANITASGSTSLCNNASVTLTATSGASYLWSNGATTQAITVNTASNYTVTVTNASGCSATSVATPVIVNASPAATITAGGPTTFCQGGNVVLTASAGATYLWSNGATTSTITATTPGTYSVLITNASGCSATSAGSTITVNAAPVATITASGNTIFCSGGSVTLTASPGASYLWSTGATTASISATTAGARTVTVTNAAGCSSTSTATTIVVNAMPTATITAGGSTTICSGSNVTLTASTGSSYLWNNGATTASIVANTSGNYTVTVFNANGCSAISTPTTVTVNNPSVANIATSGSTTFCTGGSVVLTATTASSYAWSTGATTQAITVSATGNYSVTLTNAAGCTSTSPVTVVTANSLPTATITAAGPTTFCQGGSVTLTASAGTSYVWSNGATTASVNITTPGSYTVQLSNSTGCTATSIATVVTVNALPTASITASGNTNLCAGASVTLTASAGSTYLWSTGATTPSIVVTTAGARTVTVTNAAGCSTTSSPTNIVVNALPTPSITSVGSTTICQGATVTLTTANGTGLTYQWQNNGTNIPGATAASYIANAVGSYTVQATNAAGCIGTSAATAVFVNALPVASISNSGSNTICSGSSVNLTANGGTTYTWNNGATTATIAVNATGNYTVSVTNASGCTSTASTAITVITPTVASISANGPTSFCAGQNVVLTANAGASYLWSTGATTASITVAATNNVSVQVTYASGCISTSPVTVVTANALPAATITASGATSFCPGSTVTLTASNGSSYAWTNGATTSSIVVSAAGNYGVTVGNAAGCSATSALTPIVVFATPTATITPSAATTFCQGASINLTANAGAGYAWSNGASTSSISVSNSGNFTVTVTDVNGCTAVSSLVPVTVNAVPVASIQVVGPTTVCQGTPVVLTANGGTGFTWSNNETTSSITVATTGSYGVTVSNAAGCSSVVTPVSITVNPVQVLSPIVGASDVCVGASTTYTNSTSGGVWSSDNTAVATVNSANGNVSGISTGSAIIKYQFVNASGCTSEVTKVITVNGIQPISIAASGSINFCQGGTVTLSAPAGLNYNWTNGATTQSITVNASGNYGITATNVAGCSTTSSIVAVTVNPLPLANITSSSTTLCQGSNLVLNAPANAVSYAWSNGASTQNIIINAPGNYSLTMTDANGCSASASTTIVNGINPQASISAGGATTFCQGGNVVLNAAGGTSFLWNNGATTQNISVTTPGNYSVMVTNAAGCSAMSNSTMVNVLQAPNAVATAYGVTTFCQGGSVIIATSGGTTYTWSNGSTAQSITPITSGTYSVIVTGANGCTATSNAINVTVNPTPTAVITPSGATTFCEGSSVNLVATGGASYAWNNGSTNATLAVTAGGTYTVTVTNAGGCTDTETMTVTVNEVPSAFIVTSGSTTFCQGGEVSLTAQAGNSYVWSNNATTQSILVSAPGTYSATILSPNGCSVTSNAITVTVNQPSASNLIATAFDSYTLNGILYTQSGTFTQTLTNAAGCDSTITLELTLTVGIEEGTITDVNVYPNPTSESFTIKTSIPLYGIYSVVDAQGKLVFEGEMTGTDTNVNISSVARGIYYLRIPELSEPLRVVKN